MLSSDRVLVFSAIAGKKAFTRKVYLRNFKEISQATASRDLKEAVEEGVLKKSGEKKKKNILLKNKQKPWLITKAFVRTVG